MSYILEALRKAERERNPAQAETVRDVPRARFDQASTLQQLRQYRPVLVAGLCLSMMLALTIALLHRHTLAAPAAVIPAEASVQQVTVASAPQLSNIDITAVTMSQMYNEGSGPATLDDLVDVGSDTSSSDEPSTYSDADTAAPTADVPLAPAAVAAPQPANTAEAEPPVHSGPTTSVERMQLDPAPAPQIPKLGDMPADYRAAFPPISLDVHAYDSSPKKRFIMIAGKRYNEGDTLREGPRVVQIIPDGVVFDFRGEQTLFSISH